MRIHWEVVVAVDEKVVAYAVVQDWSFVFGGHSWTKDGIHLVKAAVYVHVVHDGKEHHWKLEVMRMECDV
jgi:hypothetical protein